MQMEVWKERTPVVANFRISNPYLDGEYSYRKLK